MIFEEYLKKTACPAQIGPVPLIPQKIPAFWFYVYRPCQPIAT